MLYPRATTSDNVIVSNSIIGHLPSEHRSLFGKQRSLLINNVCNNVDGEDYTYLEGLYITP